MSITIELSEEVENRLRATAEAEGTDKETVAARVLAEVLGAPLVATQEDPDNPETIAEIGAALARYDAMRAAGQKGIPAADAFADIRGAVHAAITGAVS